MEEIVRMKTEEKVKKVLENDESECAYLDYKIIPYNKDKRGDYVKDVIAMLNSEEALNDDKFIIFGVTDQKYKRGISSADEIDDNLFQNWTDAINPRPTIRAGTVKFDNKTFGYIYIDKSNTKRYYEVKKDMLDKNKNGVREGQSFHRKGSKNYRLTHEDRNKFTIEKLKGDLKKQFIYAVMIGSWNGSYAKDRGFIEMLIEDSYDNFIKSMKFINLEQENLITLKDNTWEMRDRLKYFKVVSQFIDGIELEKLKKNLLIMYNNINSKYRYTSEDPLTNIIQHSNISDNYSENILRGVSEFFAILVNNSEFLVSCPRQSKYMDIEILHSVLNLDDWRKFASIQSCLPYIADLNPNAFSFQFKQLIRSEDNVLIEYITKNKNDDYTLKRILLIIGLYYESFQQVCEVLYDISKVNKEYLDVLLQVFYQLNLEDKNEFNVKLGLIKGLIKTDDDDSWIFLLKILHGRREFIYNKNIFLYSEQLAIPKEKYNFNTNELKIIVDLISQKSIGKEKRIVDLIEYLLCVSNNVFVDDILNAIKESNTAIGYNTIIWEKLNELLRKHKKHPNAEWSFSKETKETIKNLIDLYMPIDETEKSKYLFKNNRYKLCDDYAEHEGIILNLYNKEKIIGVLEFNSTVERNGLVGYCLAKCKISDSETIEVLKLSNSHENKNSELLKGFLYESVIIDSGQICKLIMQLEEDMQKAKIFSLIEFSYSIYEYIKKLDSDSQTYYWYNFKPSLISSFKNENNEFQLAKLREYSRYNDLFNLISYELNDKVVNLDSEFVLDILLEYNDVQDKKIDTYVIREIIYWLENNYENNDRIIEIEIMYLWIFDDTYLPLLLYQEMAVNPYLFVDFVFASYNDSCKEIDGKQFNKVLPKRLCFQILKYWKKVPCLNEEGKIDEIKLDAWYKTVKEVSLEKNCLDEAMYAVGSSLYYSPKDESGFYLDMFVAELLDEDENNHAMEGYFNEMISSTVCFMDGSRSVNEVKKNYGEMYLKTLGKGLLNLAEGVQEVQNVYEKMWG